MKEAVDDIMVTLNEAASEVGLVGGMVDAIAEAMSKVGSRQPLNLSSPISSSLTNHPYTVFSGKLSVKAETHKPAVGQSYLQHSIFFLTISSSAL